MEVGNPGAAAADVTSPGDGGGRSGRDDPQARLARALQLSEKVLDNVADGIYGLDLDGRVEFVNPAAARITGYPQDEQLGRHQHDLIHHHRPDGSPYPAVECPIWRALSTGEIVTAAHEVFWRPDGSPVPVELIAVPIVDEDRPRSVVVSFRDLTERLEAQRQTAQLMRLTEQADAQRRYIDALQRAMLTPPPKPDHLHVVVRYLPAVHEVKVGGDWYDAFLQPDEATVLVIGDVVGHDSSAAAAMGQLRGLLRALAYDAHTQRAEWEAHGFGPPTEHPLGAVLTRVEHVARGLAVETLATAILARIEPSTRGRGRGGDGDDPVDGTRVLCWSNAGHPAPVLLHADGTTTQLDAEPDLMLGVDPESPRQDHRTPLPDGSTLLLFTDGLVERRDAPIEAGLTALREALTDLGTAPLEELCDTLLGRLLPQGGADDVALLAVRAHREDRPRAAEAGPRRLPGQG